MSIKVAFGPIIVARFCGILAVTDRYARPLRKDRNLQLIGNHLVPGPFPHSVSFDLTLVANISSDKPAVLLIIVCLCGWSLAVRDKYVGPL